MWHYLPTPSNSVAVWTLVNTKWGHQTYDEVVYMHRKSITYGYTGDNEFIALASLTPVQGSKTAWLSIWSRSKSRLRSRDIWLEFHDLAFKQLHIKVLVALTARRGVVRIAQRARGRVVGVMPGLYYPDDGYMLEWRI